jgi:predicted transcriptional regulator/predicted nucleotidyltransferase
MNSETKILKVLLDNKGKKFTIRKIAERAKINYRIAYEKVHELEKEGLIMTLKIGNSKVCELTNKFNNKLFEAEYERRKELFKNKDTAVLYKRLCDLQFPFIALLFGSMAKGTAGKHSDIDILSIGGDFKELQAVASLWPEKIHLTSISGKDFMHMAKSKEFTAVSEAIKDNIILIGIEEYYRMLSNANA